MMEEEDQEEDQQITNYFEFLKILTNEIEQLPSHYHIGILQIIMKDEEECINENKNGIYVNMSELKRKTIATIKKYLDYIYFQEQNLHKIEAEHENVKSNFAYK
jgi:hypothetical protein